ncbi:unnamed protein product, partial [Urochloa humidicola]
VPPPPRAIPGSQFHPPNPNLAPAATPAAACAAAAAGRRRVRPPRPGREPHARAINHPRPPVAVPLHHHPRGGDGDGRVVLPPGVRLDDLSAAARYALAKIDVDAFPLLQLGITLCDAHGRLPALPAPWGGGAAAESVWQVALFPGSGAAAAPRAL